MVRGVVRWRVERRELALDHRSFLIVNEDQPYSLTIDEPEPVETFVVFFRPGFAADALRTLTTRDAALLDAPEARMPIFRENVVPWNPPMLRELAALRAAIETAEELELDARFTRLAEQMVLVDDTVRRQAANLPAARAAVRDELYRRLRRGIDYIEASLGEPLELATIARAAAVSPYHFHRAFRRAFGETVHGYIRRRRIERARDLLATTALSVTDVCLASGFSSPGSFSTAFRSLVGMSPRAYRIAIRKRGEDSRAPDLDDPS